MIPKYSIQEWSEQVPWNTDAMVEQDLIICRALVASSVTSFSLHNLPSGRHCPPQIILATATQVQ